MVGDDKLAANTVLAGQECNERACSRRTATDLVAQENSAGRPLPSRPPSSVASFGFGHCCGRDADSDHQQPMQSESLPASGSTLTNSSASASARASSSGLNANAGNCVRAASSAISTAAHYRLADAR